MRLKLNAGWCAAAITFLFGYAITLVMANRWIFRDHDTYLHVKTGLVMLSQGTVPTFDTYSHTMPGTPWVAHEWLSQLLMGWLYDISGWFGLVVITAIAAGLTLSILLYWLWQRFEPVRALILFMPVLIGLLTHLLARPHVLVWPIMALWLVSLLNAAEKERHPPWWSLIALWFWANMHGSFVLAYVLLAFVGLDAVLRNRQYWRNWLVFGALSVLVVLVNPLGWHILLFPFDLQSGELLTEIGEWKKTSWLGGIPVWIMVGLVVLYSIMGRIKIRPVYWLLIAALVYQAYSHARYVSIAAYLIPFFVISSRQNFEINALPFTNSIQSCKPCLRFSLIAIVFMTALMGIVMEYKPKESIRPETALEVVRNNGVYGQVLNAYGFGGFLIFENIPVYIDGRYDMYGDEHLARYFSMSRENDPSKLSPLLDENQIQWTIFPAETAINVGLHQLPNWQQLYADDIVHVYVRKSDSVLN